MSDIQVITKPFGTNVVDRSLDDAKVVKMYQEAPASALAPAPTPVSEVKVEEVKEEKREDRKDAIRRASERERKASEMEKSAKEKLSKAEDFQKFFDKAKDDPTLIAKAFNMEPAEFLRKFQNKIFDIKDEPEKPEQIAQKRLETLEDQTKKLQEANFQSQKLQYISNHILPVLAKDAEKFQLVSANLETYAPYLHDLIHAHWVETGGANGGEIWKTEDVADELEKELTDAAEKQALELKKNPKLKKYFKDEVDVVEVKSSAPVKTITSSMGSNASGGLPELPKTNADGNKIVYSAPLDRKEARRQATAAAIRQQFPERFTKNNKK